MISLLRLSTAKRFVRVAQAFGKSVTVTDLKELHINKVGR
jgi:hypothetical protein